MFYWNSLKNLRYLKRANFYPTSKHKLRVLFRPEAEIQPRTVPQIDDAEERKVFEKVPDEMADKLTEIIKFLEITFDVILQISWLSHSSRLQ